MNQISRTSVVAAKAGADFDGRAILQMVRQTARTSGIVAIATLALIAGPPFFRHLLGGHPILALLNAACLALLALVIVAVVDRLVLGPIAHIRYGGAVRRIVEAMTACAPQPQSIWSTRDGGPAVLAITRDHRLMLCDFATGYCLHMIKPDDLIMVEAVAEASRPVSRSRTPSGFGVGVAMPVGGGLAIPLSWPARRSKPARLRHAVGLAYRDPVTLNPRSTLLRCRDALECDQLVASIRDWSRS